MPIIKLNSNNIRIEDASLLRHNPDNNYSTGVTLSLGKTGNDLFRVLMRFNMGLIPNNAVINSAILSIKSSTAVSVLNIDVHNVTDDWNVSNVTFNNQPGFEEVADVTHVTTGVSNVIEEIQIKDIVQKWVNGNGTGLLIKSQNENVDGRNDFRSNESSTVSDRPFLTIDYTIPTEDKKQVEKVAFSKTGLNGNAFALDIPKETQAGDMLVVQLVKNSAAVVTFPDGWTLVEPLEHVNAIVAYKTYDGIGTDVPITLSGSTYISAILSVYRNVKELVLVGSTNGIADRYPKTSVENVPINSLLSAIFAAQGVGLTVTSTGLNFVIDEKTTSGGSGANGISIVSTYNYHKTSYTDSELHATMSTTGAPTSITTLALIPITNESPHIDGQDEHIGTFDTPITKDYTVTDTEGDNVTITEKVNGEIIRTLSGGGTHTLDLSSVWAELPVGRHTITIEANDDYNNPPHEPRVRTWAFFKILSQNAKLKESAKSVEALVPIFEGSKNAIVDAISSVDDSIVIPTNATFEELADIIKSINTIPYAEGIAVVGDNNQIVVNGLSFTPTLIIARLATVINTSGHNAVLAKGIFNFVTSFSNSSSTVTSQSLYEFRDDGFTMRTSSGNGAEFKYYAFGLEVIS